MRAFVALAIPVEQRLGSVLNDLKLGLEFEKIKWVDFNTLHLTLFFLGETSEREALEIKKIFKERFNNFKSFSISLAGFGTFGSRQNPKVLWLGVEANESLKQIHDIVNSSLQPLGFTPDERGFNPHITIGRMKQVYDTELLYSIVGRNKQKVFQSSLVDQVILYRSELTPRGPIYTPIFEQKLNKL